MRGLGLEVAAGVGRANQCSGKETGGGECALRLSTWQAEEQRN